MEHPALLPLSAPTSMPKPAPSKLRRVLPRESLQHPLGMLVVPHGRITTLAPGLCISWTTIWSVEILNVRVMQVTVVRFFEFSRNTMASSPYLTRRAREFTRCSGTPGPFIATLPPSVLVRKHAGPMPLPRQPLRLALRSRCHLENWQHRLQCVPETFRQRETCREERVEERRKMSGCLIENPNIGGAIT